MAVLDRLDEHIVLSDVWIIKNHDKSYLVEVKGKYPNRYGSYGLEQYRVKSFNILSHLTNLDVLYAIHDTHDNEWYWNTMKNLQNKPYKTFSSDTYVDGNVKNLLTCYFPKAWFIKIIQNGKLNFPSTSYI